MPQNESLASRISTAFDSAPDSIIYVSPSEPGIRRVRSGKGFRYFKPSGKPVASEDVLRRIKKLAIPPAWNNVWICLDPAGHIQARGRDARGRAQYRYHTDFRAQREETKFESLAEFGTRLPALRRSVQKDLLQNNLSRVRVLAAVVRIMDVAHVRIGNPEYERQNRSFGITTLHHRHVALERRRVCFRFTGKSGSRVETCLSDPKIVRLVWRLDDLPGRHLFEYRNERGKLAPVSSSDVNDYLREHMNMDCSAKYFRTWGATIAMAEMLLAQPQSRSRGQARRQFKEALQHVADLLHNRPATCRKYYIHPMIESLYEKGELQKVMKTAAGKSRYFSRTEHAVLKLLRRWS